MGKTRVDLRPAHGVTSSVRYNPKVRDLSADKDISGHDTQSRHSLNFKHSESMNEQSEPQSSKLKVKKESEEVKESWSEVNKDLDINQQSSP